MDLISFVFIPQPNLVLTEDIWSDVCQFSGKTISGQNEDFFVIAIHCDDKKYIQSIIMNIMAEKIKAYPSEYNVQVAAWSSWCTSLLLQNPNGRLMNEQSYNYLCKRANIQVSRYDILYLPADDSNWPAFVENVRQRMPL